MSSSKKRWIIGIDVGGTKISVSLGLRSGKIKKRRAFSSRKGLNPQQSFLDIKKAVQELLASQKITAKDLLGIGIGVPGPVHPVKRQIERSPNLPKWKGFPLKEKLRQAFSISVFLENDADAAALGEKYFGDGRGISDFVYITVSTGVGSGIVINNCLVRGSGGVAGELGHLTIVPNGLRCLCGKNGCLEAYASGTGIAGLARRLLKQTKTPSSLRKLSTQNITGSLISKAAREKDKIAIQARETAADYLGIGIANVINLLNPKRIILGGGVMETVHNFWSPMMKAVKREAWPLAFSSCEIKRSSLLGRTGDLGAIAVVLENNKK